MSISINTDRYAKFISEVNSLLPTGIRVLITIYNDQAGNEISNDLNGNPVQSKQFTSLAYQYPTETQVGFIKLSFSDGSEFKLDDGNTSHWYFINETPFGIEQFV
jgi:hypothetical protein